GEALEHLGDARDHALAVGQGEQAEHIAMEAALAEGEALVEADPRSAVDRLTAALESARRRSFPGFDDRMLAARARAWRALGNVDAAEEDLAAALEVSEGVRGELVSERLRLSYFDAAQDAFDAMIRLQADERASPSGAFAAAERARARLLLDMVGRDAGSVELPGPLGAAEVARRLPEGTVLVEYAVLPDRLLVWTVRAGSVEMTSLPRAAEDLARQVAALRSAIDGRADGARIRALAGPLYETLLRPALDGQPEGAPLVVVPDRFLSEVPFPALFDARRGRYLIEDRPVAVAPSATLYVSTRERLLRARRAGPFRGDRTALAVGNPAFDRRAHPRLDPLPAAAEEAAAVASLYPGSVLLLGDEATPEALVDLAPAHRILHVSGHAVIDPESPWNHRLILAPGSGGPSSLDARRIASLRLRGTELVVLSACRTLPGGPERESFHGLAAAFLAAGPPVVVSSLWEIDDRPTRALMLRFHRALAGGAAPADALRQAQIHLLRQDDPTLATPAAWGAFEAFGGAIAR
ncbi:MAG: CHAT domain-containing protein, partial [Acidobacteriota bacterium]